MSYEIIIGLIIGLVVGIASIWVAITTSTNKLNTCMQLQTQILNNQAPTLKEIYNNSQGTHSTVKNTHERVGRMESIQACHGKEHDSHSTNLLELHRTCQDIPKNVKALLG